MFSTSRLHVQEIQPSGPNGPSVTVGDFVRDLLLEQVSHNTGPVTDAVCH